MSGCWGKSFYWKNFKVCSAKDVPKISENCLPKIMYWNLKVCHFLSKSPFLVFSYYMMLFSYIYMKKYNLLGKIRVKIGQAEQKMEKHVRFSHILTIFDVWMLPLHTIFKYYFEQKWNTSFEVCLSLTFYFQRQLQISKLIIEINCGSNQQLLTNLVWQINFKQESIL